MARYAVFRISDGLVVNSVEWDGNLAAWSPPAGHEAVARDDGNVGDTFDGSKFTPAEVKKSDAEAPTLTVDKLARVLLDKRLITQVDIDAA